MIVTAIQCALESRNKTRMEILKVTTGTPTKATKYTHLKLLFHLCPHLFHIFPHHPWMVSVYTLSSNFVVGCSSYPIAWLKQK